MPRIRRESRTNARGQPRDYGSFRQTAYFLDALLEAGLRIPPQVFMLLCLGSAVGVFVTAWVKRPRK